MFSLLHYLHLLFTNILAESALRHNVGMTSKQLKIRISQHMGRSSELATLIPMTLITAKYLIIIRVEDFKIITSCPNEDLFILESIYIHKLNPNLNERNSSFDLCILI